MEYITKRILVYSIIYTLFPLFDGCDCSDQTNKSSTSQHKDAYLVDDTAIIATEYSTYLVVQGTGQYPEERLIYVGGTLERGINESDYEIVWWSHGTEKGPSERYGIMADSYWDKSNGKYTAAIRLNPSTQFAPGALVSFTANIGNGTIIQKSANFNVRIITERKYPIKYCYQVGCDLFNSSIAQDFGSKSKCAFNEAGTTVIYELEKQNLTYESIDPRDAFYSGVFNYVINNIKPNAEQDHFRLIIVKSIWQQSIGTIGLTIPVPDYITGKLKYGFSFVLDSNMRAYYSGDDLRKCMTHTAIHELGHLRSIEGKITNDTHTQGHNGILKDTCVMLLLNGLTQSQFNSRMRNPFFCSGHKQYILNQEYY